MSLPIVGAHFRPPAKALLQVLPQGAPMILRPEPTNAYDPNAIQILVATSAIPKEVHEELEMHALGFGFDLAAILAEPEWHIGYVPRQIAAVVTLPEGDTPCILTFDASGRPAISTPPEAEESE